MIKQEDYVWRHWGIRPDERVIREAVSLYQEGWTLRDLGKRFNRSSSNIWTWINKFARELDDPTMSLKNRKAAMKRERAMRRFGIPAPEHSHDQMSAPSGVQASVDGESDEKALKARIAKLERELEDARLMRDFYEEMINIAEKDFNVPIRKKGGAKR